MEDLIRVEKKDGKQLVSARELYITLGYDASHYARWSKANIQDNPYAVENEDWIVLATDGEPDNQSFNQTKDYAVVVTMAKKIAMMAKTEVGDKIRDYFLECEKKGKIQVPQTFREALLLAAEQQGVIEEQQKLIEMQSPKAEYFDNLVDRKLNINFRDTAKEIGIKESVFISFLLDKKYIYRDAKNKLKPIAVHAENGLFEIKEYSNDKHSGNQTLITPKGRETFRLILNNK